MGYNYQTERAFTLTDDGQRRCFNIRRIADEALTIAGAVRADKLMNAAGSGSSWSLMACVDRLIEVGELREIKQEDCAWQHRIFVAARE